MFFQHRWHHTCKCVFVHKWHWYAFCIERSQSIIMHFWQSVTFPAASYKPCTFSGYGAALCLIGVVPPSPKSLKWRRNNSHLHCFAIYSAIISVTSNGGGTTWVFKGLQNPLCIQKWHWYAFRIDWSQSIIMLLVHPLPFSSSSYKPHSLVIAVHWVQFELFPHLLNPRNEGGTAPSQFISYLRTWWFRWLAKMTG